MIRLLIIYTTLLVLMIANNAYGAASNYRINRPSICKTVGSCQPGRNHCQCADDISLEGSSAYIGQKGTEAHKGLKRTLPIYLKGGINGQAATN